MAFKLTKQENNRRMLLRDNIRDARLVLDEVIEKQVAIMQNAQAALNAAIADYNELVDEAYGFVEDIHSEREGEYDDRSERWQEGERGEAAATWLSELEEVRDSLTGIEPVEFDLTMEELTDHSEILDDMPEGAE